MSFNGFLPIGHLYWDNRLGFLLTRSATISSRLFEMFVPILLKWQVQQRTDFWILGYVCEGNEIEHPKL